jgi:Ca2+-binding RTX toxin-like protein
MAFDHNDSDVAEKLTPGGGDTPPPGPPPPDRGPDDDSSEDGPKRKYAPAEPWVDPKQLDFDRSPKRELIQKTYGWERQGERYETNGQILQILGGAIKGGGLLGAIASVGTVIGGKILEDVGTEFKGNAVRLRNERLANWDNKAFDPIIIDFGSDGLNLASARESGVFFDIDGDGYVERTSWVGGDALLVRDINNDGLINSGLELGFANGSQEGLTDFDYLRAFDANEDGVIDALDPVFAQLSVWVDANQNGITDTGELESFEDAGGISIDLSTNPIDPQGLDIVYWFDVDGDGLVDADEIFSDENEAPEGAIPAQRVEGSLVFETASITTTFGVVTAYAAALEFDPLGATAVIIDDDLVFELEGGETLVWRVASNPNGESFDLIDNNYAGAIGSDGDDTISNSGNHAVIIFGGLGNDIIIGGAGDDILAGDAGVDSLNGGEGDDILFFDAADLAASISGGGGYDTAVLISTGGVTIDLGDTELESIIGNDGDDTFGAGSARDVILAGGAGNDVLIGGDGGDQIAGDAGADSLVGGAGDDILLIDQDDILVDGGAGYDLAIVANSRGVTLDLADASIESITGNLGNDVFDGAQSENDLFIEGYGGNDILTGGSGSDRISGGAGDDAIVGGAGIDAVLFSGKASDYSIIGDENSVTVIDLNPNDGDDGTDVIQGVERLVFSDTTVHLDENNFRPVGVSEEWRLRGGQEGIFISAAGLLANDADVDRDHLAIVGISAVLGGDVSIASSGNIVFQPASSSVERASFDYLVSDGHDGDLSPKFHPAMGRVPASFEPIGLGGATGRGAEPSV